MYKTPSCGFEYVASPGHPTNHREVLSLHDLTGERDPMCPVSSRRRSLEKIRIVVGSAPG